MNLSGNTRTLAQQAAEEQKVLKGHDFAAPSPGALSLARGRRATRQTVRTLSQSFLSLRPGRKCIKSRRAILPTMPRSLAALRHVRSLRLLSGTWAGVFAALLAFGLTPAAHATLAVIVPARDGLVIAADSRLTFMGASCDGAFKILIPARPARTAVIVTGDSIFVAPPPAGTHHPCRWVASAPRLLDIGSVVTHALEQQSGSDPARISTATLTHACTLAVAQFQARFPAVLRSYAGREIFSVVVASYDPARATATLRNFVLRLDARTGRIHADRRSETVLTPQSPRGIWIYGETSWLHRTVYTGPGRHLLTAPTRGFLEASAPIASTARGQAVAAATNVLSAAIRAAQTNPPPTGIGGRIRAVFLGANPRPQPLPINPDR